MAASVSTGPLVSLGALAGGAGGVQPREYSDEIGPSIFFGGMAIPASGSIVNKDRTGAGEFPAVYGAFPIRTINSAPAAGGASAPLTVAGLASAGVALPNVTTYAAGRAPGANGVGLDVGLDAATFATAGTATLTTIANAWRYRVGQWIGLLNGGLGGATLMSQITAINLGTGVLTVSPVPAAATTGQISLSSRFNPNAYGAVGPPNFVAKAMSAGSARIVIPEVGGARGVGVAVTATGTGGPVLIQGLDTFGKPQSETITTATTAITVWGKKTYAVFLSATPQYTEAGRNLTVLVSDLIGLPLPVLSADSIVSGTFAGTALVAANFAVYPADLTVPASLTTGDPRGGIQMSANGPGATPGTPLTLNGTSVLVIDQRLNPLQVALGGV